MSEEVYLAIGGIVVAALLVELWKKFSSPEARLLRAFRKMPIVRMADCRNGDTVRLSGRIRAEAATRLSPITQTPCVGYRVHFTRVGLRDASEPTTALCEETSLDRVNLQEGSDIARIVPDEAKVLMPGAVRRMRFAYRDLPESARVVMARRGFDATEVGGANAEIDCEETVLLPDDHVIVSGVAHWEVDGAARSPQLGASFRESPRSLRVGRTADRFIVIARVE